MWTPFILHLGLPVALSHNLVAGFQPRGSSFAIRYNSIAGVKLSLILIQFVTVTDNSICNFLFGF